MKLRFLLFTLIVLCFGVESYGQVIWTNPITGTNPSTFLFYTAGQTFDSNITVSGISRGTGIAANPANDRYNAKNWSTSAIDFTDFFEFTIAPNAGYRIDFSNFVYTGQSSATGPRSFVFRSSIDGFVANIGIATSTGSTISLSAAAFQNRTAATTFRLYAFGANAPAGTFSIKDFTFNGNVNATCSSTPLGTVTPTSGPVGTEVTINAPSGLTGATATFNGINAAIVSTTATQLVVTIPIGAASGNLIVKNAALCASASLPYIIIDQDLTSCDGSAIPTELFMSEVTDSNFGGLTYVEIYNGTSAIKNLGGYSIKVANNNNTFLPANTFTLPSFNLAIGSSYIISIGTGGAFCSIDGGDGSLADYVSTIATSVNFGTGQDDNIALYRGTTLIDSWGTYLNANWEPGIVGNEGGTFRRKNTAVLPKATYSNADWDIINFAGSGSTSCPNNDYSDIGVYTTFKTAPSVVSSPLPATSCTTKNITLSVTGSEGIAGGFGLTFQWYVAAPGASSFTAVSNSTLYSGAMTQNLTISDYVAVNNYQYYCQIRENTATCFRASNAFMIKDAFSTTWSGTWSNGVPSVTKKAVISADYNTDPLVNGSFSCCSLKVTSGTLTISDDSFVSVTNEVVNNTGGIIDIKNNGTLIQVTDVDNATANNNLGTIKMQRITTPIYRFDYTYWSSPVTLDSNYYLNSISNTTLSDKFWKWNEVGQSWSVIPSGLEYMVPARGYIVRGPQGYSGDFTVTAPFPANFVGKPNNGIVTIPVTGTGSVVPADYKYNLLGNPYPSALSANEFLKAVNNPNLDGTIYLWTHATRVSATTNAGGFYYYNNADYATYNFTGSTSTSFGTAATTGGATPSGFIAAAQSFFVRGLSNGTALFNNSMRVKDQNMQFFRLAEADKNRVWLNVSNENGGFCQTLIGYLPDATNEIDRGFDGEVFDGNALRLYSIAHNKKLTIQGRALPFDDADVVPLGLKVLISGVQKIEIADTDGFFSSEEKNIYLEDRLLHVVHNLKSSAYEFPSEAGVFDDRFELRYRNETLGIKANTELSNAVIVSVKEEVISVVSANEPISKITLYDVLGRKIVEQMDINSNSAKIFSALKNQTLVIKIVLGNGQIVSKKLQL